MSSISPFRWLCALLIATVLVAAGVVTAAYNSAAQTPLPPPPALSSGTQVFFDDGTPFPQDLPGAQNRTVLTQIPLLVQRATMAAEDKDFLVHGPLDPGSIVRAAIANATDGRVVAGGSTITQQYVKNVYLTPERTLDRKLDEAKLAISAEAHLTKEQILTGYLNTVYFGRGAYGIEAAAGAYFGTTTAKLSAIQATTLAAVIRAPSHYADPQWFAVANGDLASLAERRNYVLATMASQSAPEGGYWLDPAQLAPLSAKPIQTVANRQPSIARTSYPYLMAMVQTWLSQLYGEAAVAQGGLKVYTTFNRQDMAALNAAVAPYASSRFPDVGATAINPRTGAVTAVYGGYDFANRPFNNAIDTRTRAIGSTQKAFVLAAALEAGVSPSTTFPAPACLEVVQNNRRTPICNDDNRDRGQLSLADAIVPSVNTVYVQAGQYVGMSKVVQTARRLGLNDRVYPQDTPPKLTTAPAAALGTDGSNTFQVASAFATFAAGGRHTPGHFITRVTTRDGRVLAQPSYPATQVIDAADASQLNGILQRVITDRSGTAYGINGTVGRPVAGKTGTTSDHSDALFTGYTPQRVVTVRLTNDNPANPVTIGGRTVFGGGAPATIAATFLRSALAGEPALALP